jgi:hypothetical protein
LLVAFSAVLAVIAGASAGGSLGSKLDPAGEDSAPKFARGGKVAPPECETAESTASIKAWKANAGLKHEA